MIVRARGIKHPLLHVTIPVLVPRAMPGWHGMRHSGILLSVLGGAVPQTPKALHGQWHSFGNLWDLQWGFLWHSSAPGGFAWRGQGTGGALGRLKCPGLDLHIGVVSHRCVCACMPVYLHRCFNVCALPGRQSRAGASLSRVCMCVCSPAELNGWCWPCPCSVCCSVSSCVCV